MMQISGVKTSELEQECIFDVGPSLTSNMKGNRLQRGKQENIKLRNLLFTFFLQEIVVFSPVIDRS